MSEDGVLIFVGMVFAAVFLLAQGMIVPVFGESRHTRKRLKRRLEDIDRAGDGQGINSLLREKYLRDLSPLARRIESLPMMESLARSIEKAGKQMLAHRVVLLAATLATAAALVTWLLTRMPLAALFAGLVAGAIPFVKISRDRTIRLGRIEEQLPDARMGQDGGTEFTPSGAPSSSRSWE